MVLAVQGCANHINRFSTCMSEYLLSAYWHSAGYYTVSQVGRQFILSSIQRNIELYSQHHRPRCCFVLFCFFGPKKRGPGNDLR